MTSAASGSAAVMLPPDLTAPDYGGANLTGIAGAICRAFGLPAARVLPPGLVPEGRFACVVLLTLDALGWEQLAAHRGALPAVDQVLNRGTLSALTSVLPTSTTAALTTLLSGLTPQEHGMLGHTLYLRELGLLADLLRFHPAWLPGRGGIIRPGERPRDLFPVRTLFEDLVEAGVETRALMHKEFIGTALSSIHLAGATTVPFVAASELCVLLRRLVENAPRPLFVSAYWHAIDGIAHVYGPGSPEEAAELGSFFSLLRDEFLDRLSPAGRRGALLLVTADHGQMAAAAAEALRLDDHPELAAELLLPPAGDRRMTYLYVREGRRKRARALLSRFADRFHVFDSEEALRRGFFGLGAPLPQTPLRIGDLVLLARGGATFVGPETAPPTTILRGRHGGASAAEMRVPLLALPL